VIVQHLLVFVLIIVMPLWDWYEIPRLKASTEPRKKVRFYRNLVIVSWILAVLATLAVGLVNISSIHLVAGEITWLETGSRGLLLMEGITVGMMIAIFIPAILALRSDKIRAKAGKAAKKFAFILPSTPEERHWWWLVCLTAGICEEVIYRGFLLHYSHIAPFHLSLTSR
jgi:membrane protease YdiL (CAAX protease family)